MGEGGFEVTVERQQGRVTKVEIASRRGASCRLLNPWGKSEATLSAKGEKIRTIAGEVFEFPTQAGATYVLACTSDKTGDSVSEP